MSTLNLKNIQLGDNPDPSKNFVISTPAVADGTLSIKRQDGTNVLSIAANGKAVIPGVVGTVAQSGGVPTGQIIESGENANGQYIRYSDGTQICWAFRIIGPTVANGVVNSTWTLPAEFSLVPTSNFSLQTSVPNNYMPGVGLRTTTTIAHHVYAAIAGTTIVGHTVAIGRWF